MLVLGRRIGQTLIIGSGIEVKVVDIEPRTVWLMINSTVEPLLCRNSEALRMRGNLKVTSDITLYYTGHKDCAVARIGIEAPARVEICRGEVAERYQLAPAPKLHFDPDAFAAAGSGMEGDLQSPPVRKG